MWLNTYISAFMSSPIATCVLTLGIIFLLVHTIVPSVLGCVNLLIGFWDRYESVRVNKYTQWWNTTNCQGESRRDQYGRTWILKQLKDVQAHDKIREMRNTRYDDLWVWVHGGRTLEKNGNDWDAYVFLRHTYPSKEAALQMSFKSEQYYGTALAAGVVGTVALTFVGWVLDWLLFSYFLQTLVVITIIGGIAAVMFGGRFAFDLGKKVSKIDAAVQATEEKKDGE